MSSVNRSSKVNVRSWKHRKFRRLRWVTRIGGRQLSGQASGGDTIRRRDELGRRMLATTTNVRDSGRRKQGATAPSLNSRCWTRAQRAWPIATTPASCSKPTLFRWAAMKRPSPQEGSRSRSPSLRTAHRTRFATTASGVGRNRARSSPSQFPTKPGGRDHEHPPDAPARRKEHVGGGDQSIQEGLRRAGRSGCAVPGLAGLSTAARTPAPGRPPPRTRT